MHNQETTVYRVPSSLVAEFVLFYATFLHPHAPHKIALPNDLLDKIDGDMNASGMKYVNSNVFDGAIDCVLKFMFENVFPEYLRSVSSCPSEASSESDASELQVEKENEKPSSIEQNAFAHRLLRPMSSLQSLRPAHVLRSVGSLDLFSNKRASLQQERMSKPLRSSPLSRDLPSQAFCQAMMDPREYAALKKFAEVRGSDVDQ